MQPASATSVTNDQNKRYDIVCPMESAWALHKAFPTMRLYVATGSGHSAFEPEIMHHLVKATSEFAG